MKKYNLTFLLLNILLLSACQGIVTYDENSPYFLVPVNSELNLHQPIKIPAEKVAVFLQDGQIKPYADINKYYPHCKFEVWTMADNARTIHADTFIVETSRQIDVYAWRDMKLAWLFSMHGNSPSILESTTILRLRSPRQPDVFRLSCLHWEDPAGSSHLSIKQIRVALGKVFTLKLPPEPTYMKSSPRTAG